MTDFERVTAELRAAGWRPTGTHSCGCNPWSLCGGHAEQRAVEHHHPEVTR